MMRPHGGTALGLVPLGLALSACGGDAPGAPALTEGGDHTSCPISAPAQRAIELLTLNAIRGTAWVADQANPRERGFALHALGLPVFIGRLQLAIECREPMVFVHTCNLAWNPGPIDSCHRGRCEGAGVTLEDAYMVARPRELPDDRHRVEYDSQRLPGRVVYDPNPFMTYRTEVNPAGAIVSADIDQKLTLTPPGGSPIDLSHIGFVTAVKRNGRIETLSLAVAYVGLSHGPTVISVTVDLDAGGVATGTITDGLRLLARISGGDRSLHPGPAFRWQGGCEVAAHTTSPRV